MKKHPKKHPMVNGKVVVTGGAGYIGAITAQTLLDSGYNDVVIVDDLSTGHRKSVPDGSILHQGDIRDAQFIDSILTSDVHTILHFAGKSLVGESVEKPDLYWDINVKGTETLLNACVKNGIRRFVFSSTAATYGEPKNSPITEDVVGTPTNPYGASKLAVDKMLTDYSVKHGLGAVSLRYFNVAGASGSLGEIHSPETHLIPNVLAAALSKTAEVTIFGSDWPTPDGTCIRDYIHVQDLAEAHVLALALCHPSSHTIINLGTGTGYSVTQVIATAETVTKLKVPRKVGARRPGDPAILVASNDKAKKLLGWKPQRDLETIIQDAWNFMTRVKA